MSHARFIEITYRAVLIACVLLAAVALYLFLRGEA